MVSILRSGALRAVLQDRRTFIVIGPSDVVQGRWESATVCARNRGVPVGAVNASGRVLPDKSQQMRSESAARSTIAGTMRPPVRPARQNQIQRSRTHMTIEQRATLVCADLNVPLLSRSGRSDSASAGRPLGLDSAGTTRAASAPSHPAATVPGAPAKLRVLMHWTNRGAAGSLIS